MTQAVKLPDNISYFQIVSVKIGDDVQSVEVLLLDPSDLQEVFLKFDEVCFLRLSKFPDNDGAFQIGEIKLCIIDVGDKLLDELDYQINLSNKIGNIYHLSIEGSLCLDVVSKKYECN